MASKCEFLNEGRLACDTKSPAHCQQHLVQRVGHQANKTRIRSLKQRLHTLLFDTSRLFRLWSVGKPWSWECNFYSSFRVCASIARPSAIMCLINGTGVKWNQCNSSCPHLLKSRLHSCSNLCKYHVERLTYELSSAQGCKAVRAQHMEKVRTRRPGRSLISCIKPLDARRLVLST